MERKAFSLVEMLIIVAILAILGAVLFPFVLQYVEDSKTSKAKADIAQITDALTAYELRDGEYPASEPSLLLGRYLQKIPLDPWGNPYVIIGSEGIVYSKGPDRR